MHIKTPMKYRDLIRFGWLIALVALGMHSTAFSGAAPAQQVVVKFSDSAIDPERPEFLDGLSEATGYPLIYVRPLLDGAHVLRVARPLSDKQFTRLVQRLAAHRDIQLAEEDRNVRVTPPGAMSSNGH